MYKHRHLAARLREMFATFPVVVVSGARQVGKTTLLRQQFPDLDYVVFDPSIDVQNARADPDLFLQNHPPPVVLDEIQYAPELVAAIKRRVDASGAAAGQYLLTGSQQWQVLRSLGESLAGRAVFLDLGGFSLAERAEAAANGWLAHWLAGGDGFAEWTKAAKPLALMLNEWLWRGDLPKATELPIARVPDFWAGYQRTYVERDARLAGEVRDWQEFGRFMRLLSALTAQEINFSQLGRDIGLTPASARNWLRIVEATFQWYELPAFSGNPVKRVSQRPKGHIADTGLACFNNGISSPAVLPGHPLYGAFFETAVVGEVRKQSALLPLRPAMYHWRSAAGAEVDLVLEYDGRLYPVEIKLTANPGRRDGSGIAAFRAAHGARDVAPGLIVCAVESPQRVSAEAFAIPWNLVAPN